MMKVFRGSRTNIHFRGDAWIMPISLCSPAAHAIRHASYFLTCQPCQKGMACVTMSSEHSGLRHQLILRICEANHKDPALHAVR